MWSCPLLSRKAFSQKNNIKVELVPFTSVVERNTAFMAGQLDGFVDSIWEAININKEQDNCKVVGHNLMPDMFVLVASPSAGINSPEQLKGKEIGTSTGTIMDYALDRLLASAGVCVARDQTQQCSQNAAASRDAVAEQTAGRYLYSTPLRAGSGRRRHQAAGRQPAATGRTRFDFFHECGQY